MTETKPPDFLFPAEERKIQDIDAAVYAKRDYVTTETRPNHESIKRSRNLQNRCDPRRRPV
jgi:hypothetical protein